MEILNRNNNFKCFTNKQDVIVNGEYLMSRLILAAGYNLDTLLTAYGGIDWRDRTNWDCNSRKHANRHNHYFGVNVHPFEVVFHVRAVPHRIELMCSLTIFLIYDFLCRT
jgi:hypothetical protein